MIYYLVENAASLAGFVLRLGTCHLAEDDDDDVGADFGETRSTVLFIVAINLTTSLIVLEYDLSEDTDNHEIHEGVI